MALNDSLGALNTEFLSGGRNSVNLSPPGSLELFPTKDFEEASRKRTETSINAWKEQMFIYEQELSPLEKFRDAMGMTNDIIGLMTNAIDFKSSWDSFRAPKTKEG